VGVDSAWKQENLMLEKYLKMAQDPTCPVHTVLDRSYLAAFLSRKAPNNKKLSEQRRGFPNFASVNNDGSSFASQG
jgi:hypothetical protein